MSRTINLIIQKVYILLVLLQLRYVFFSILNCNTTRKDSRGSGGTNSKTGKTKDIQVGRKNKRGDTVARERRALDDIENATGSRPEFVPYND